MIKVKQGWRRLSKASIDAIEQRINRDERLGGGTFLQVEAHTLLDAVKAPDVTEIVQKLVTLGYYGPNSHNQALVEVEAKCEFEPWGRATETWDIVWYVTLLPIGRHVYSRGKWEPTTAGTPMKFKGDCLDHAVYDALEFLNNPDLHLSAKELYGRRDS